MLLSELITELQYRVEDDSINTRFPEDQKINAINNAYYTLLAIVSKDELFSSGPNYKYGILLAVCREFILNSDKFILYANPSSTSRISLWTNQSVSNLGITNEYPITEALKPIILGMAESELWRSDNDPTRAKEAYAEAINILQAQEGK